MRLITRAFSVTMDLPEDVTAEDAVHAILTCFQVRGWPLDDAANITVGSRWTNAENTERTEE